MKAEFNKEKILHEFSMHLMLKGYSPLTIKNYLYIINDFLREFQIPDTKSIQKYFLKKNISKNARATQTLILRSFAKFLKKELHIEFETLDPPKTSKTLPTFLTKDEVKKFLEVVKKNKRDFAIIAFLIYTGVRVGELINIKIEDVNLGENYVRIKGKGDKERFVPISLELSNIIKEHLKEKHHSEYLFESKRRKKFSPLTIQLMVKRYAKETGIQKKITPHKLRHTFATLALESGISPITIGELLGHSSLNTTMKYTHVTNKLATEAVRRISEFTNLKDIIENK
ncbi:site-specific tyrosine recombinase/integron integrase [Caldisericum exile]|uniref:Tyrosine recombinase n=1 Tax=Caldisericum exile (strain DSM 21853 / NBRC 104410 / AZM16c01) TaxID=511051 RepID=A0A7U6GEX7_CALEA|nr:site-specific tyrosine recombinase/integron integrase [Caldisericum exile]BAL81133.1 putative tyrosine recombinase [Caldisericum exile AZM16c01]